MTIRLTKLSWILGASLCSTLIVRASTTHAQSVTSQAPPSSVDKTPESDLPNGTEQPASATATIDDSVAPDSAASRSAGSATTASPTATLPPAATTTAGAPDDEPHGLRLAFQARLDVLQVASVNPIRVSTVPIVTPGIRFLGDLLFTGLGFEFYSESKDGAKGFALSPTVTYDLLENNYAALYVAGWANFGTVNRQGPEGSHFFFGMNVGAGVRAKVHRALSIGSEWGWAFRVEENGPFSQGVFGTLMLEASLGL